MSVRASSTNIERVYMQGGLIMAPNCMCTICVNELVNQTNSVIYTVID